MEMASSIRAIAAHSEATTSTRTRTPSPTLATRVRASVTSSTRTQTPSPDGCDVCAAGDDNVDADSDGIPDACDICDLGPNGADSDGDGVPNACDACPAEDDRLDADGDGVPDACDICPGGIDTADSDGDDVPNFCDVCPGFDDAVDTDSDGAPDDCDCAASEPAVFPGNPEVCDGLDNDCAGGVDDGLTNCSTCAPGMVDWDFDGICERAGTVVYVDVDATGANDGTSWADAYTSLDSALEPAVANTQVWIAEGVYEPSIERDPGQNISRRFRGAAGVALVGGFTGGEGAVVESTGDRSLSKLTSDLAIDRLFDLEGDAIFRWLTLDQNGVGRERSDGGIAAVVGGSVRVLDCYVTGEAERGGAFFVGGGHLEVVDSVVERSSAAEGGGLAILGGTVTVDRTLLVANEVRTRLTSFVGGYGGSIYLGGGELTMTNSAVQRGASIITRGRVSGSDLSLHGSPGGVLITGGSASFTNVTFAGNVGQAWDTAEQDGTPFGSALYVLSPGTATVVNSVLWRNEGPQQTGATLVSTTVEGVSGCDPLFPATLPADTVPLPLGAGSECVDAGDTSMSVGDLDIVRAARVQGVGVDLGATESTP